MRYTEQQIDVSAREIAQRRLDDVIDESKAAWDLAALVYRSIVPEQVAGRYTAGGVMLRGQTSVEDLADSLRTLVIDRLQRPDQVFRFDLIAGGASFCGWIRKFCQAAVPSKLRDLKVEYEHAGQPSGDSCATETLDAVQQDAGALLDDQVFMRAASDFAALTRRRRPEDTVCHQSRVLAGAYDLPSVYGSPLGDPRLAEAIADEGLAHRVATQMLAGLPAESAVVEHALVGFSTQDLAKMVEVDPRVAHLMVKVQAMPLPAAKAPVATSVRSQVAGLAADGQRLLASRAVTAWLAASSGLKVDARGRYFVKPAAEQAEHEQAWEDAATALIRSGFTYGGSTPQQLSRWLSDVRYDTERALVDLPVSA